jgi:hypothetical protein
VMPRDGSRPGRRDTMDVSWPGYLPVPALSRGPNCIADGVLASLQGLPTRDSRLPRLRFVGGRMVPHQLLGAGGAFRRRAGERPSDSG